MHLNIRHASTDDVESLCILLNQIINIGGSTAREIPLTQQEFSRCFLNGSAVICCLVAYDTQNKLWGFQALLRHEKLDSDCADISTFAQQNPVKRGVGTALFAATSKYALDMGFQSINATIRKDNQSGLAYYTKMGFEDHAVTKDIPLIDGTLVDRISKRIILKN